MSMKNELALVESESFGSVTCDFYKKKDEILMTREQIGIALEYANPTDAIFRIHERHKSRLDKFSVIDKVSSTDGKSYDTYLYNSKGVYEVCRWSRQPKADAFMDWVWSVIEAIRKNELQPTTPTAQMVLNSTNKLMSEFLDIAKTMINQNKTIMGEYNNVIKLMTAFSNEQNVNANNIKSVQDVANIPIVKEEEKVVEKTWRDEVHNMIETIAHLQHVVCGLVYKSSYSHLEKMAHCNLDLRLRRQQRFSDDKLNILDIIEKDNKLKPMYLDILSAMIVYEYKHR